MTLTYDKWMTLTGKKSRSDALKLVDTWFEAYEQSGGTNKTYLRNLANAFKNWRATKQKEETKGLMTIKLDKTRRGKTKDTTTGKSGVELLAEFIRDQNLSDVVIKVEATGLEERVAVVQDDTVAMSGPELRKVNEAIRQIQESVRRSRDVVIGANTPGADRNMFVKWFGAYDYDRWKTVRDRYRLLDDICVSKGIVFTDGRQDPFNDANTFAWAYPGEVKDFPNMWLGTAFFNVNFGPQRARKAYSDTLGTLIHELTHACFHTADVPVSGAEPVDQWGHPTNNGVDVCNDPKNDCRLAETRPDEAILNADNYGEFTVDVYGGIVFNYVWP